MLRDSYTETEVSLLRAASAASVASGATDRSGNTDNCVEEYVCDVPFAGKYLVLIKAERRCLLPIKNKLTIVKRNRKKIRLFGR
jgi:hypothetical protein